jgi:hypothetical protein
MPRGRNSNHAFVATAGEDTAIDVLTRCLATDWIDRPATQRQQELGATTERFSNEWLLDQLPQPTERSVLRGPDLEIEI